ncbi:hypothetical protein V144x_32520 [Gimesia aquarii]|uniref:Uncharacterized protein n=1 Tax=Gimesia aquarii TaxID=2527964 RepID=A0A517VXN4_9PLAN|nr:hypothetical protein V144x_32520 [Gimesia aquarii]
MRVLSPLSTLHDKNLRDIPFVAVHLRDKGIHAITYAFFRRDSKE